MKKFVAHAGALLTSASLLAFPVFADDVVVKQAGKVGLGFAIPSISYILSFIIRFFFVIAGLVALIYLLLGAFAWVTSSGEKEAVKKAQDKITNAIIGLILIVVVLAIIWTLEQVVFNQKICLGISCEITIPQLIQ